MIRLKLILVIIACFVASKSVTAQEKQPNVLWILTDDHRYDAIRAFNKMLTGEEMSPLGYVESPQTDKLASMGTTFINSYCQAMGCAPSRASMHSGRYPFRSGIYEFEYHNNNTDNSYPYLPEQMEKLGYQTAHFGKLGVRIKTIKNDKAVSHKIYQTDVSFKILANEGMAEHGVQFPIKEVNGTKLSKTIWGLEFLRDEDGRYYYISELVEREVPGYAGTAQEAYDKFDLMRKHTHKKKETPFSSGILAGVSPRPAGKTRDGYYTSTFKDYLENENKNFAVGSKTFRGVDPSKPVFAHIGYDFPHTPVLPPADYRERFSKKKYKVPELTPEEWEKMPAQMKRQVNNAKSQEFPDWEKQKMIQDYYAFCAYGDALVGESVDAFIEYSEKHSQEWTVVFVCGDHGWKLNDHGAYSKFTPWDIDSHNPIIVVSSDKEKYPAGKVVTNYTEFVDIAPTILAEAGADLKSKEFKYLDGMNMAKTISGDAPIRDYVIGESHAVTGPRAYIRTKDYVFSMQTRPSNKKRGENFNWALKVPYEETDPALYDLTNDPGETTNLAFDDKYTEVVKKMQKKLTDIVLGDGRAEIMWSHDNIGTKGNQTNTDFKYNKRYAKGAHDYKLEL
ncbi:sulfatase-like hydrolase/transferase [Reichenbachiella versicolor]|uniref:sulfatase-like hydrolase/transferase n=1 Tax=Reichenbachiella versicolor TaxID=1821036 RepID=UPI000D6DDED5|nr:sulfatase-like hydrolase/transferase [Reichenbachiella versicolor]